MFLAWMHTEAGYTFTGDDGIYALTYPEMRTLFHGYDIMKEQQEMQQKGVDAGTQSRFKEYAAKVNSDGGASPSASPPSM